MDVQRISVKYYMENGRDVAPEIWHKTFNEWISSDQDEVLVDVVDYSHVHQGPVTLLVGYEANASIDAAGGRVGLLYSRKRPGNGNLSDRLHQAFQAACRTCKRLETDLEGEVTFGGSEVRVTLDDRLLAPNTPETLAAVRADLERFLERVYAGAEFRIETPSEAGGPFTVDIHVEGEWTVDKILENM